jgi:hypothetical protein
MQMFPRADMLETALVQIADHIGNKVTARVMLDTGAHYSLFLTQTFEPHLALSYIPLKQTINLHRIPPEAQFKITHYKEMLLSPTAPFNEALTFKVATLSFKPVTTLDIDGGERLWQCALFVRDG